jgi:ABC-type spermidine/putrescine transport system permease subunit I
VKTITMSDKASRTHTIELRLKTPEQIFNVLDPSPLAERDLEDKAERFIVGWAQEAERGAALRLSILMPADQVQTPAARSMPDAIRNYFDDRAAQARQDFRELLRIGWRSLMIGIAVMLACLVAIRSLDLFITTATIKQLAEQSLIILGWVANWRPIEIFLYDWWPLLRRYRLMRRLAEMPVELKALPGTVR